MPKHIIILPIILLLVLAGCSSLPALPALSFGNKVSQFTCQDVTIGVLIGQDNDPIAQEQRDGYEMALEEITQSGGINGCELKLSYRNESTDGNPRQTYTTVRSLVDDDKAVAILGGTSNTASMYAASLANYFNIPYLIPSASGEHILPEENRWAYRYHTSESFFASGAFDMVKKNVGTGKKVTILFEDTTFGNDAAIAAVNAINQYEMVVSGYYHFDSVETTYEALATQAIQTKPEILYLILSQPDEAEKMLQALEAQQFDDLSIVIARAGGFNTYAFVTAESEDVSLIKENLILLTQWTSEVATADADLFVQNFSNYTKNKYGTPHIPSQYSAEAYKSLKILATTMGTVLQSSGLVAPDLTTQRDSLRQQIFAFKENTPFWGNIDFSSNGQNVADVYLLQMQNGEYRIVYPEAKAEEPLILMTDDTGS